MNYKLWWTTFAFQKNFLRNSISFLRKEGVFVCPNGFLFVFNKRNKKDIKNLFFFSLYYGVKFSADKGFWFYKEDIISLPNGIKFYLVGFHPLIFAETFLLDIHFSDFNLENKMVIQAGGFIGDTALYYASRNANVFSFEPDINSFNRAINNIKLNPDLSNKIVMRNYAIGNDGTVDFPIDENKGGGFSIYAKEGKKTIKIISKSIQTILNEFNIDKPYLLDLDIKGNEFDIIMDSSISKFEMIRIEYSTMIGNKKIGDKNDIIEKLKYYGFKRIRTFKHNELKYDLSEHGTIEAIK